MLDKLNGNVAVGFYRSIGQILFPAKFFIIIQNTIMSKGKSMSIGTSFKGMIVVVILLAALSGKSCMTDIRILRWWRRTQLILCRKS